MALGHPIRAARRRRLVMAASLFALCGCAPIPDYQHADAPLPRQWAGAPVAASSLPARWWDGFQSAQLDALVRQGLAQGADVRIAVARLEQARGLARIAGANRYPFLDLALGGAFGNQSSSAKDTALAQLTFAPDPWGQNRAKAQSAEMLARATRYDVATARNVLAASIATGYFQLLALDERIALATRIADDARNLLSLVETQASLGAASRLDVSQQRNALQTFQAAIPVLQRQRSDIQFQLAVLVGTAPERFSVKPEALLGLAIPEIEAISPADAIARRPEVQAAEARLRAANFDVRAARAAFLPSMSITADAGALLDPLKTVWSVTGALAQPLLNRGALEGQLRVDRAHAEELLAAYRQAILQALQQAESQMSAVARMHEAESMNEAAVDSATESLRLSRIQFQQGASDLLAVIINERTLYQAQDTLLQARMQRLQAIAALCTALGAGTDQPLSSREIS
ncbi:efflux transporter outer membrane subunit [Achromobacter aloeverae]